MAIQKSEKQELLEKLLMLNKKQAVFQNEINDLQLEITNLQVIEHNAESSTQATSEVQQPSPKTKPKEIERIIQKRSRLRNESGDKARVKNSFNLNIEKFIGENLINKVGIAVLIIGVSIGIKYAIDNNLISPALRIILGYLVGSGLTLFAIKLRTGYRNFSAVLFSGAMAIYFFISYAAFTYYNLFPLTLAVSLMVLVTIFTVLLALYYNHQIIAHFGLVGAYIIPYLLKEPFTNISVLFTYMAIINGGILFISARKKWSPLNYVAFVVTWTIFSTWFLSKNYNNQLGTCLLFLTIFFTIFYLILLFNKILQKEEFKIEDIFAILINSSVLFFIGYFALKANDTGEAFLGLFTFTNAIIHFISAYIISKANLQNKNLFYWAAGLVITFITVAIAIQFNNQITAILWSIEAAWLFWFGRSRKNIVIENLSYALIFLAVLITASNWASLTYNYNTDEITDILIPFLDFNFMVSLVTVLCFCFIFYTDKRFKISGDSISLVTFKLFFPIVLLSVIYFTFFTQISMYWNNQQVIASHQPDIEKGAWVKEFAYVKSNIKAFKHLWVMNYSLFFVSLLAFVNYKWIQNKNYNTLLFIVNSFILLIFITNSLPLLTKLRGSYLVHSAPDLSTGTMQIGIRYISYLFLSTFFYSTYKYVVRINNDFIIRNIYEIVLSVSVIWVCSDELINWLDMSGSAELYKHGLSILWGISSLLLIIYGIWKKKRHLRITAISLFGITLMKLFFYDLTYLDTIPKTIVFVLTGTLLLIVSFLYNKYKHSIFEIDKN